MPFVPDGDALRRMQILTLSTAFGPLHVLACSFGRTPYPTLRRRALRVDIGPATVLVASIDDLLETKRAAGRDKDKLDVESLEALKEMTRRRRPRGDIQWPIRQVRLSIGARSICSAPMRTGCCRSMRT